MRHALQVGAASFRVHVALPGAHQVVDEARRVAADAGRPPAGAAARPVREQGREGAHGHAPHFGTRVARRLPGAGEDARPRVLDAADPTSDELGHREAGDGAEQRALVGVAVHDARHDERVAVAHRVRHPGALRVRRQRQDRRLLLRPQVRLDPALEKRPERGAHDVGRVVAGDVLERERGEVAQAGERFDLVAQLRRRSVTDLRPISDRSCAGFRQIFDLQ